MTTRTRLHGRLIAALVAIVLAVAVLLGSPGWVRAVTSDSSYLIVVGGTGDPTGTAGTKAFLTQQSLSWHGVDPDSVIEVQYPASIFGTDATATNLASSVAVGVENLRIAFESVPEGSRVVFAGVSQGAIVISQYLTELNTLPEDERKNISAVLAMDETRPNGGLLTRLPNMSLMPLQRIDSLMTPQYNGIRTVNITHQYDGFSDMPATFGPLAIANALLGILYRHVAPAPYVDPNDPTNVYPLFYTATPDSTNTSVYIKGNQTDVLLHAQHLPILQPFRDLAELFRVQTLVIPVLDAIEPALQTLIEISYDRANPTADVRMSLFPRVENLLTALLTMPGALAQGAENFANDVAMVLRNEIPDSPLQYPVAETSGIEDWQDSHPPFVINPAPPTSAAQASVPGRSAPTTIALPEQTAPVRPTQEIETPSPEVGIGLTGTNTPSDTEESDAGPAPEAGPEGTATVDERDSAPVAEVVTEPEGAPTPSTGTGDGDSDTAHTGDETPTTPSDRTESAEPATQAA